MSEPERINQLGAEIRGKYIEVPTGKKWWQFWLDDTVSQVDSRSTENGDKIADDEEAFRWFSGEAKLIKIVQTFHKGAPCFVFYLEDAPSITISPEETRFIFGEEDVTPSVRYFFSWNGTKQETSSWTHYYKVEAKFRDHAEFNRLLTIPSGRPQVVAHGGKVYRDGGDGTYKDDSGSLLPYVVLFAALASGGLDSDAGIATASLVEGGGGELSGDDSSASLGGSSLTD